MTTAEGVKRTGRPKGSRNKLNLALGNRLSDLAREHTEVALRTLVSVMKDKKAPHAARVTAANSLLDRGYGKPVQHNQGETEHKHIHQVEVRLIEPESGRYIDAECREGVPALASAGEV